MRVGFYPKLAWNGIRKNKRLYTPYILTCIGMIMMYYIIIFLSDSPLLNEIAGGETAQNMLGMGTWVIAVFACIFLFYTNSFLIRRRKKEFGLYNILGMGKRNIAVILLWETLIIAAISLTAGCAAGIAFSKLAELGLLNIIRGDVEYSLTVSWGSIGKVCIIFPVIFVCIFLNSLRQIHTANPVELLHSENAGEKPPKGNWMLGILGIVLLGAAYYLAVTIREPLSALTWFFVAVIMVIIGTYLLFISGSVLFCRILQKNKSYYYKSTHFVSVSSLVYRMKRNGAGLASICILGTMVLVMHSSTACLYFGAEDSLRTRYPRNISVNFSWADAEGMNNENIGSLRSSVTRVLEENHVRPLKVRDFSPSLQLFPLLIGEKACNIKYILHRDAVGDWFFYVGILAGAGRRAIREDVFLRRFCHGVHCLGQRNSAHGYILAVPRLRRHIRLYRIVDGIGQFLTAAPLIAQPSVDAPIIFVNHPVGILILLFQQNG